MTIKYHVRFSDNERSMLEELIKQEKPGVAQYKKRNAGIVLAMDENEPVNNSVSDRLLLATSDNDLLNKALI